MGFFKQIKDMAQQGAKSGSEAFSRFSNKDFSEGAMAACALMTGADGRIEASERQKVAAFIMSSEKLKAYDVQALRTRYDAHCDAFTRDPDFGKVNLFQVVGRAAKRPEDARAILQVAVLIANADGSFDESEKVMLRELYNSLKISPSEFAV